MESTAVLLDETLFLRHVLLLHLGYWLRYCIMISGNLQFLEANCFITQC